MALPINYDDYEKYFNDAVSFLKINNFLVSYSNVEILSKEIFQKIPTPWIEYSSRAPLEDLLNPQTYKNNEIFKNFFEKISFLSPQFNKEYLNLNANLPIENIPNLSVKKLHEINSLSRIIHSKSLECNIHHIMDFGSGLGYLSHLLNTRYGLKVLGIEGDKKRVETAKVHQKKTHKQSIDSVKHVHHFISSESQSFLQNSLKENFNDCNEFLIVGLHACADLTVDALKLCIEMDSCKGLLIMPCCYHKMSQKLSDDQCHFEFENFPLSKSLKLFNNFFHRPFMRLSCQRSQEGWHCSETNSYQLRIYHLMCRAVLELYASKENGVIVKHGKRKVFNKTLSKNDDFNAFIEDASLKFKLKVRTNQNSPVNIDSMNIEMNLTVDNELCDIDKEKLLLLWNSLTPLDFKLAAVYTVLQDSLQVVCENIVLLDKLAYLKELNVNAKSSYIKVTDSTISPRCLALVVEK